MNQRGLSNAVLSIIVGVAVLLGAGAIALLLATTCGGSANTTPEGDVYISIGDSVGAGNGASDTTSTSFAALVAADEQVTLFNVAKAGATTDDAIHDQLIRVINPLQGGRVRLITISAGGNDLAGLIPNPSCVEDPLPAACPLDEQLAKVEANLNVIMRALRDANARTPIVLVGYPNFFSGTGHAFEAPAARVLPRFNDLLRRIAERYPHTAVADPYPSFEGRGGELTHVLDPQFDPHPNDAGHAIIADAVEEAAREARK
jgi:lysophospholipase L1-like esterase